MNLTRRAWIAAASLLPVQARIAWAAESNAVPETGAPVVLPAKADFPAMPLTYLDSGTMHPVSFGAKAAIENYYKGRAHDPAVPTFTLDGTDKAIREKFANLINAKPEEICLVQSTTAGEQLVIKALNFPESGGRIVTDVLHFPGSFYLYEELGKKGVDVAWVRPRDGMRIDNADMEAAIDRNTKLVAISLTSTINGFQHDLMKVCEIAHAKGAYVYADIIHAAGTVPVDIKESGVDFAASASYKWLMGDFGLGFLYVRSDLIDKFPRSQFGYEQLAEESSHVYPFDPPGNTVIDYAARDDATGHYAMGTTSSVCAYHLNYSLDYISRIGVPAIQAHRAPLLAKARKELIRLGYKPMTPEESTAAILTFAYKDAPSLAPRLDKARVKITLGRNRFRITPSVFNDMGDIDRLVEALG
jgi:selenocysteine lyase/cysteine desulfurase